MHKKRVINQMQVWDMRTLNMPLKICGVCQVAQWTLVKEFENPTAIAEEITANLFYKTIGL